MEEEKLEDLLEHWLPEDEDLGALKELLNQQEPARDKGDDKSRTAPATVRPNLTAVLGTVCAVEAVALVAVVLLWIL